MKTFLIQDRVELQGPKDSGVNSHRINKTGKKIGKIQNIYFVMSRNINEKKVRVHKKQKNEESHKTVQAE